MSQQDSQETNLPYGDRPSLTEMAVRATEAVIKADYRRRKKKMPRGEELRAMAEQYLARDIARGCDNHVGTAEPRH